MTSWAGNNWLRSVLFAASLVLVHVANAEVVPDLYSVSVPVAEQNPNELQRAATIGLRELAVRISGRSSAASDPALSSTFANAMHYLEQYRYERNTGGDSPWSAQLRFASAQVDAELRKSGVPVWGGNRPALTAVVVIDDKGSRAVIDDQSLFAAALREQWRRRGLVLHLPRNVSAVNIDDVMRLDNTKVGASLQERGDGLMLGRIVLAPAGACESRWSLNLGAQMFNADTTSDALSRCVASALDHIVDNFSTQYAIAPNSGSEGIVLRVTGIARFEDYSALLSYLRRLAIIKNAQPVLVSGEEVLFQLKLAGNTDQLVRQLALESRLTSVEPSTNSQQVINARLPAALSYRWAQVRNQ